MFRPTRFSPHKILLLPYHCCWHFLVSCVWMNDGNDQDILSSLCLPKKLLLLLFRIKSKLPFSQLFSSWQKYEIRETDTHTSINELKGFVVYPLFLSAEIIIATARPLTLQMCGHFAINLLTGRRIKNYGFIRILGITCCSGNGVILCMCCLSSS